MGKLYIVATPIGNLKDMTLRGLEVLKAVRVIVCEDTRVTRKLLQHYQIDKPLLVYHEFSGERELLKVIEAVKQGDVALVSDAGTPGISDPGFELVRELVKLEVEVVPLPGATAITTALVGSGLPTDSFVFGGFLPKKSSGRAKVLQELKDQRRTLVFYESPYRLKETLKQMLEVWGDRQVCIARELTKKFEEFIHLNLTEAVEKLRGYDVAGEVVIVVEGAKKQDLMWREEVVVEELRERMGRGEGLSQAVKEVTKEAGWKKKLVYELGLKIKKPGVERSDL